ncbi:MAG TPA: DUF4177 domain-containing protein [Lachnospiraceae bacterium]
MANCKICGKDNAFISISDLDGVLCRECNENVFRYKAGHAVHSQKYFDNLATEVDFADDVRTFLNQLKSKYMKDFEEKGDVIEELLHEDNKKYIVLQVTLKEKFIGTGSGNLIELEDVINKQASKGYRLHTISTASANSTGLLGGDRIQATMVFERIDR